MHMGLAGILWAVVTGEGWVFFVFWGGVVWFFLLILLLLLLEYWLWGCVGEDYDLVQGLF